MPYRSHDNQRPYTDLSERFIISHMPSNLPLGALTFFTITIRVIYINTCQQNDELYFQISTHTR